MTSVPPAFLPDQPDLVRHLIYNRGFRTPEDARLFLRPKGVTFPDLSGLTALDAAVARIRTAISTGERILVWGDFDADGQTSTSVFMSTLRKLGAVADYFIPHRQGANHGLSLSGIDAALAAGTTLLITCDCGTSDHAQIEYATKAGVDVIVSDHHEQIGEPHPAALIVNSSHLGHQHPIFGLAGVGVSYIVCRHLLRSYGEAAFADTLLDLVAIGTVADMVPQTLLNRALLMRGLPRLWSGARTGIAALLEVVEVTPKQLDTETISFKLAPMLNAAGRLTHASEAVELLLCQEKKEALVLAHRLKLLNQQRQYQMSLLEEKLDAAVEEEHTQGIMVICGHNWPEGFIGLSAGRMANKHNKPCIVVTTAEGKPARGSCRTHNDSFDILPVLHACKDLFLQYGGHMGAAGFTMEAQHLPAFKERIRTYVGTTQILENTLIFDYELTWDEDLESPDGLLADLASLAPFTEGNPLPVLVARTLHLVEVKPLSVGSAHADLWLANDNGVIHQVRWWRYDAGWQPGSLVDVAVTLTENTWLGRTTNFLTLLAMKESCIELSETSSDDGIGTDQAPARDH